MIAYSFKKCVVVLINDSLVAWNDLVVIRRMYLILRLCDCIYVGAMFVIPMDE